MADAEGGNAIIIKRVKKGGHAAAHGGAWKIAYADFVTAMMAFFLLLWLLNSVTEESLSGISNYFAPTAASKSTSGAGGLLGGKVIGDGAGTANTSSMSAAESLPPPTIGSGGQDLTASPDPESSSVPSEQDLQAAQEDRVFEQAKQSLEDAIAALPEAALLKKSLMVDNTIEGLRIQIVDQKGLSMFASGQSSMFAHTKKIIETVSRIVEKMPQKIAVSGHTDATQFADQSGYTNWELSADRALASRRVLIASGIPEDRIDRVVGKAATEPLVDDPTAPKNRRIAIVLLREFKAGGPVPGPKDVKAFNLQ